MTGKFSPLISDTKLTRKWKLKTKVYIKKNLKTGLCDKGETWNVNCQTAYHYLWSNKDPQFTPFSLFKRQEEANIVTL
jgi:hypothetical protein